MFLHKNSELSCDFLKYLEAMRDEGRQERNQLNHFNSSVKSHKISLEMKLHSI